MAPNNVPPLCVQTYRRMLIDLVRMQDLEGVMEILTEMVFNEGRMR